VPQVAVLSVVAAMRAAAMPAPATAAGQDEKTMWDRVDEIPEITAGMFVWSWSQYLVSWTMLITGYVRLNDSWSGLAWSMPLAAGIYGVWMMGHDAAHGSIFFGKRPALDKLIALICLDGLVMTTEDWETVHHKEHHAYPGSDVDGQRLTGKSFFVEWLHGFWLLLTYISMGLVGLAKGTNRQALLVAVPLQIWRLYFLASLGPFGFPATTFVLVSIVCTVALLTHSNQLQVPSNGWRQRQLQQTCDFLPGNWLAECLSGGVNMHGVHHVFPGLPRALHGWASQQLRVLEPVHYRGYATLTDMCLYWWHRINPLPMSECVPAAGYYSHKDFVPRLATDGAPTPKVSHYCLPSKLHEA
jgi:fatty acid desaturase